ncbi:MAG: hypothetical protein COA78_35020 [Blastopirellula sp.]|nr:MAG: hypothetical protein COA78_35020 [Blastopirellula sp.]
MKLSLGKGLGRLAGLIVVTVFAVAVMYVSDGKWFTEQEDHKSEDNDSKQATPKSLVPVQAISIEYINSIGIKEIEQIEIEDSYAGIIEPFERYVVALEIPGRIELLGLNKHGQMLDVGDEVTKGQVLATLDRRILTAQLAQATATLENTEADYNRLSKVKLRSPGSLTEAAFQEVVTQRILANASKDIAEKNWEDATVYSPVEGVISKRMVNPGESVNLRQQLFEIVEVDRVLLTIGIPESRIADIQRRYNQVKNKTLSSDNRQLDQVATLQEEQEKFKVTVQPIGLDRYGGTAETMEGHVYRIAETADERNSLFRVQVVIENQDRLLKPGIVAMAYLVTDTIPGYRLPIDSVLFRENETYAYFIEPEPKLESVKFLYWEVGKQPVYKAKKVLIPRYVEQGTEILVEAKDLNTRLRTTINRGHRRLTDGDTVQLTRPLSESKPSEDSSDPE